MPALASGASSDGITAQAATPITEYMGGGYMGFSAQCAAHGWSGVQQVMVRVQPQGVAGNPRDETQMALYFPTGTIAIRFDKNERNHMYQPAAIDEATYVWNGPWSPEVPTMAVGFNSNYGDSLFSGEQHIHSAYLSFKNFNEIEDCTAGIRMSVGRN